jgi:hypothetical protein
LPFGPGAVTMTGPSTGRLSMPVEDSCFHGLGRGRPTLTESSFTGNDAMSTPSGTPGNYPAAS